MAEPVLEVRGVSKAWGAIVASREVTLDLRPGEIHALIGPNGAGKSTLIKQITGEERPDSGSIRLAGQEVTDLGTARRARLGLGRTYQISTLAMDYSVLQNAVLGAVARRRRAFSMWRGALRDPGLRAIAMAALDRVGLADLADRRTAALSHGQRRQLEVAVALTLGPRAFLMDEPMAGLGAEGSAAMTTLLDGLRAEAPILLVEHDMDAVFALADRISVLVDGALIASGPPEAIRTDPAVRAAYLGDAA